MSYAPPRLLLSRGRASSVGPSQTLALWIVAIWLTFAVTYVSYVLSAIDGLELTAPAWGLLFGKTAIELIASLYGIGFFLGAVTYLFMREPEQGRCERPPVYPPVGIVYLCCDDADGVALESLARLEYPGKITLVAQDDSSTTDGRAQLDTLVAQVRERVDWDVRVLRRPNKEGGKPAAVNYVIEQTGQLYDYFILCDNDSIVLDGDTVSQALNRFGKGDDIAVVQCRTVHVPDVRYCPINSLLAQSISAFHAFLAPAARFGWMPFIGHNAFLRTDAFRHVGGMTPGFFSDDLDLTVRLNLQGYRVVYGPEIRMAEIHPPTYAAFRKRSYKWAYGCVQTLRAHWKTVLLSPSRLLKNSAKWDRQIDPVVLRCSQH